MHVSLFLPLTSSDISIGYNAQKDRLVILIGQNGRIDPATNKVMIPEVMKLDQAKIMSSTLKFFPTEILQRYDVCIAGIAEIVKEIDKEYVE